MLPPRHVRPPVSKMWHPAALAEIERILPEQAMTVSGFVCADPAAPGAQDVPAIGGVRATIAQHDPSMATMFEVRHLDHDPSCPDVPRGFAIAPAVEPIIVDGVPIVDPQLGSVIGNEREPVMACPEDAATAGPAHSEVVATMESRPGAASVAVVDVMLPP